MLWHSVLGANLIKLLAAIGSARITSHRTRSKLQSPEKVAGVALPVRHDPLQTLIFFLKLLHLRRQQPAVLLAPPGIRLAATRNRTRSMLFSAVAQSAAFTARLKVRRGAKYR